MDVPRMLKEAVSFHAYSVIQLDFKKENAEMAARKGNIPDRIKHKSQQMFAPSRYETLIHYGQMDYKI